jgi:hypothetical protein
MSDSDPPSPASISQIQGDLHEIAKLLRDADHLEPEAKQTLADLLDEFRNELRPDSLRSPQTAHLAEMVAQAARSLHEQQGRGPLDQIRDRIDQAIGRAEAEAPVLAGVVRRFVDALANIGI